MELVEWEDESGAGALSGTCPAVLGPGILCGEAPAGPAQVYCVGHVAKATLDRRLAEAELEGARTAAMTRTARALDRMVEVLVDVADSTAAEPADRIRAATKVLDLGGMLGRNGGAVVSLQQNVSVTVPMPGEVADTDRRLLALIEQLGPEGQERAVMLRQVIEVGLHDADA